MRPENEPLLVLVPTEHGALAHVDRASGIVGYAAPTGNDELDVWYEGNRHGYANVATFADKCMIAAGRAAENYPTTARARVPRDSVVVVGVYDEAARVVIASDETMLARWIGTAELDPVELVAGKS